ncbi:MAG: MFS transporter [Candidatus Woesearchaeota archaeon]
MIINHNKFLYNKFVKTTAIDAFYYLAVNLYVPFLAPYLSSLGWSEPLKGLFFALFGAVGIFASPIVGSLSDRIGRFKMMMFGMIL